MSSAGQWPIGVSTWVWTSPLNDQRLAQLAPLVVSLGFDVIELPIEQVTDWQPVPTAELLAGLGLGVTTCAVMTAERDLTTDDGAVRAATQAYLVTCIDMAAAVGARVVAGPIYAPVGRLWRMDAHVRSRTITRLIEALRPVSDHAGERGVTLALEPLNRFETSVINTVDQALEVIDGVDSPALGICLDTFHMNIEEKDPAAAASRAGSSIAHVQASGTDRGAPGADRFEWAPFVAELAGAGYRGPLCIESFTADNDAIARAASVWRPLAPSQDELATDGLAFLRALPRRAA